MTDQDYKKIQDLEESLDDLQSEYNWLKEESKEKDRQINKLETEFNELEEYKEELAYTIKELLKYAVISEGPAFEGRDALEELEKLLNR